MIKNMVKLIKENGTPFKFKVLNILWIILLIVGPTTLCIISLNMIRKWLQKRKNNGQ